MPRLFFGPQTLLSVVRVSALLGVVLSGALLLSGCGNKGPLYLPPDAPITEVGTGEPGTNTEQDQEPEQEHTEEAGEQP